MDALTRLAVLGSYVWDKGAGLPGDWNGRLAPSFEHLQHYNRVARKPNKTRPKQQRSIGYRSDPGLRNPDGGTFTVGNRATFFGTHKIPDDVIRVGREIAFDRACSPSDLSR